MRLIRFFFSFLVTLSLLASPESQIIILDNFISEEDASTLMAFYDSQKNNLNIHTDNELSILAASHPNIEKIVHSLSNQVISLIQDHYALSRKPLQLDHAGLYARIKGNYCPYHADNISFECPIHGKDQGHLRSVCPGNCPGSKFVPNHTFWRKYTALIYLNDDFEGGEILFEDGPHNQIYKKTIPICAHMLVLAPNGPNFYHEVLPIRSGKRYSLHLWFKE